MIQAQGTLLSDTCETATRIETPFFGRNCTIEGQRPAGSNNPAFSCQIFDSETIPIVWYEVAGDGSCLCLELRSNDNAFIVGLYQPSSSCESLTCVANTDFTSESIVWRTNVDEINRIAVSLLPGGPLTGAFDLAVVAAGEQCNVQRGSFEKLPGSCSVFFIPEPTLSPQATQPPTIVTTSPPLTQAPTTGRPSIVPTPSSASAPSKKPKNRSKPKEKTLKRMKKGMNKSMSKSMVKQKHRKSKRRPKLSMSQFMSKSMIMTKRKQMQRRM